MRRLGRTECKRRRLNFFGVRPRCNDAGHESRGVGTNLCDSWPVISELPFAKERCTCSLVKRCSCPDIIDGDARQKHRSSEQGNYHRGVDLYFPFEIMRATYCWFLSVL